MVLGFVIGFSDNSGFSTTSGFLTTLRTGFFSSTLKTFCSRSGTGSAISPVRISLYNTASSCKALVAATYKSFTCASSDGYFSLLGSNNKTASNSRPLVYATGRIMTPLPNSVFSRSSPVTDNFLPSFFFIFSASFSSRHTIAMVSSPSFCQCFTCSAV